MFHISYVLSMEKVETFPASRENDCNTLNCYFLKRCPNCWFAVPKSQGVQEFTNPTSLPQTGGEPQAQPCYESEVLVLDL